MNERIATHVILLTPVGRGAVATVRIEGPQAAQCVATHFRRAKTAHNTSAAWLAEVPIGRILWGRFGPWEEEVILCRREEHAWDLHCHGGIAAVEAIISLGVQAGCRETAWHEWVASVAADDPFRAEAQIALAEATTERTAAILLDQYHGALSRAWHRLESLLASGQKAEVVGEASRLLERGRLGLHLTRPWRIVLTGRPNVGKSSLMNALLGYERSIVFAQPGTTRDVVTASTAIDGWPVSLADTAGLRSGQTSLESAGIRRAELELQAADLIVFVLDASRRPTPDEQHRILAWPQAVIVENKSDLVEPPKRTTQRKKILGRDNDKAPLRVSARTGQGLDRLVAEISTRLVPRPPQAGEAVPFLPHHLERIRAWVAV